MNMQAIYFTECAGTIGSDWWSDIKVSLPSNTYLRLLMSRSGTWIICKTGTHPDSGNLMLRLTKFKVDWKLGV